MMQRIAILAALLLPPVSLCAQWLNVKTAGIPRTADGKPDLTAPTPRTADGKPDLSGLWAPGQNLLDFPLFPQSATQFESSIASIEFSRDAGGEVTDLTIIGALGDEFRLVHQR
jgi:hypothetical protein